MKKIIIIVIIPILLFLSVKKIAKADSAPPIVQAVFYFEKDGRPINKPIDFKLTCYGVHNFKYYGFKWNEKTEEEKEQIIKVSEIVETCKEYGCKFETTNIVERYTENIKYCDLNGEIDGKEFNIENIFGDKNSEKFAGYKIYDESKFLLNCNGNFKVEEDGKGNYKYYQKTPQYEACMREVGKLCDKNKSEKGENYYSCEEKNGRIVCRKNLKDITDKILKTENHKMTGYPNGFPFVKNCEMKINVPIEIEFPTITQTRPSLQPTKPIEKQKNESDNIFDFFKCSFFKLFGKNC